jgi:hypothetical protein
MSQLAVLPRQAAQTRAVSCAANEIETARDYAYASLSFGTPGNAKPLNELTSAAYAHGLLEHGIGRMTYQRARAFLALLPFGARPPEFSIDPDGEIAIEWYQDDDVLSISLGYTGRLAYVFERDGRVLSGTSYFSSGTSAIPNELLEMINTFQ